MGQQKERVEMGYPKEEELVSRHFEFELKVSLWDKESRGQETFGSHCLSLTCDHIFS